MDDEGSGKTTTNTTTTTTMMDEPQTPGSDCNSNPANENQDHVSSAFIQDNTDFWFIDYRDGGLHVHPSVLSSLSASYTKDDLGYYDDLARNLDANLAEVDMENCKTSDLHTLLNALPTMCTDPVQHSEGEDSACSTTSICKSSLLFSPVKEIPVLPSGASYSVDSLDCEDMLITCKTNNKDNYTIAFEGSMAMYSDSSDNQDFDNHGDGQKRMIGAYEAPDSYYGQALNLKNMLDLSMACSDTKIYTTWSNLYKHISGAGGGGGGGIGGGAKTMKRHPSGNNNTEPNFLLQQSSGGGCINASDASTRAVIAAARAANDAFNGKSRSRSLPDLKRSASKNRCDVALNFSVDSGETSSRSSNNRLQSSASMMSRSMANDHEDNDDKSSDSVCGTNTMSSGSNSSSSTGTGSKKLHNMSLVRLYMKQKSTSAEGMSLTLDSESGCWPTTSNSGESANNATLVSKQQQQQQQNNSGSNDLAIKWVKTDSLATATTTTTENTSQAYKKMSTIACSTSMDDLTSRSILSLAKDDANNSCSDKSKLLSDDASNCTTLKISTGIQTAGKTVETEDNGVQTSLIYPPHHGEQTSPDSGKASSSSSGGNNTISTSSLKQQTTTREHIVNTEKPVYVVYPNYALPDLSFLSAVSADRISLKPQAFRPTSRGGVVGGRRPFSCGDFDALKHRNFNHVKDWDSLNFLLPKEYRQAALQCVPEAAAAACNGKSRLIHDEKQPLYWLQPRSKKRAMFFNDAAHQQNVTNLSSSSSTGTQPSSGYRGSSTILSDSSANQQNSANSATGNNPLYLYRYDSVSSEASLLGQEKQQINRQQQQQNRGAPTLPKRSVSLPQNECPPRPPLPRGILRKHHRAAAAAAATANNNNAAAVAGKRSSMFEQGNCAMETNVESNKRMSLQEPYFMNNDLHFLKNAGVVESEKDIDEAEEKQQFDRLRGFDNEEPLSLDDEFKQLDDFLNRSNYSTCSDDSSCDLDKSMKLRSCVKKFLALKINQDIPKMIDMTDSQKKTVSFAVSRKQGLMQDIAKDRLNVSEATDQKMDNRPINLEEKKKLIKSVGKAVDVLLKYWNSEPVRSRQDYNDKNECSQLCLNYLCPAIYAVMSDELKPHLDSTFGPISNSVWQVVEASSQQGPLTKTLNDLVQKINAEDFIPEGMLKFRAFVFGLLNLRSLDAWFAYLCSRESVVRKHYKSSNLFVSALSCPASREVVDSLLNVLQPLIYCPFQLDLLYQYRQLHNSFGVPSSEQVIKRSVRPRSCVMYDEDNKKDEGDAKKRWSHNPMSAMFHVQDRLDDSDDYTDSLEHTPMKKASPNNNKIMTSKTARQTCGGDLKLRKDEAAAMKSAEAKGENHFRKLQEKWECLGREDSSPKEAYPLQSPSSLASPTTPTRTMSFNKSKIPRPLMSPVKSPSGLPVPVKNPRASAIPAPKKSAAPTTTTTTTTSQKKSPTQQESPRRTSRVDQTGASSVRSPMTRPSSLPYKTYQGQQDRNGVVHRRAASTSLPRPHSIAAPPSRHISSKQPAPKLVRATSSGPPSRSGHLAFTEGETIKVILEVDARWLLCERGTRKGLVPRNCVKPLPT